jgi:hypothetical protein
MVKTGMETMYTSLQSDRSQDSPPAAQAGNPAGLPFGHLNLRRNPFGELELSQRARLAVAEVDRFVRRLKRPGFAVQFTGEKGRGKTTHLLAIMRHFPEAAYVHVGENERPPRIPLGQPLLIDEAQRLPRWRRQCVFRRPGSLVLGTHQDLKSELTGAGFEVETVEVGDRLNARRLRQMLNRRIDWARRGPGAVPQVTVETAQAMIGRFGDDVRAIEWHLYEQFQGLRRIEDV